MEPDMDQLCQSNMYHKAHDMLKKGQKKQCSAILDRWYKDDLYRGSLSKLGWDEETIMEYDKIALEDHSYTATREERRRNENSCKLSSNAKGAHGPMDQRDVFEDAKETCARPYRERTAITGCGYTPIPPQQQVRQRPNQQFEGHTKNIRLDLIHLYGNIMFPPQCIRPSSSSRWQPNNWWSTWNWHSWDSSSWSELFFFFKKIVPDERHFAWRKFSLLAIDWRGRVCAISTPTAHTFFSCACCQRVLTQPVVTVVLQVPVISSRINFTHMRGSSTTWSLAQCVLPKSSHLIAQCHTLHRTWALHMAHFPRIFNPASIYVNLSVVHWRNSHPSQCVDRMVALGGYALPSGPGHVHVDWTLNCTKFTPRHACRSAYTHGMGATVGPQFKDSVWNRFMELWSRTASSVTPGCLKKDEPSGMNVGDKG